MKEAFEEVSMPFVADEEPSSVLKPADGAFDLPAFEVAAQSTSVLSRRFLSSAAMRSNLFNAATCKSISQPIGVGRFIIEQSLRTFLCHSDIDESFDCVYLGILSRFGKRRDGAP